MWIYTHLSQKKQVHAHQMLWCLTAGFILENTKQNKILNELPQGENQK